MTDALEDHQGTVRIENRTNTNLRFADYINGTSIDIRINGEKLDEVEGFKYLGAVVTYQGSKPEVLSRITQTKAALARLKTTWNDRHIPLNSKIRLTRSLVISVLLYTCKTWTLTADILKKLQATEMRCFWKLLGISYRDHITNDAVRDRIKQAIDRAL